MAKDNLFQDFSRVASGALSALSGVRDEVEVKVCEQVERLLARMDVVTREEFDAVKEMAALARTHQETLEARIVLLEAALHEQNGRHDAGTLSDAANVESQESSDKTGDDLVKTTI